MRIERARARGVVICSIAALGLVVSWQQNLAGVPPASQQQFLYESELTATRRVFPTIGPGFRSIRRAPDGAYYILTAPAPAVQIYDATGARVGQVPGAAAAEKKAAGLTFGESLDADASGRVAVFDRGAGMVKVFARSGNLSAAIPAAGPASVVLLQGGDLALTRAGAPQLISVYDREGNLAQEYGDREEFPDHPDVDRQLNLGELAVDDAGNTYFAFTYLPEPTVRKFDRAGYLSMEISLKTLEFQAAAQAARRAVARSERGTPALHRIISAMGVDGATQDVWLAMGTLLLHFDSEGRHIASYRTFTQSGGRIEASVIVVEANRLLLGADPTGIYEFPRPDKTAP